MFLHGAVKCSSQKTVLSLYKPNHLKISRLGTNAILRTLTTLNKAESYIREQAPFLQSQFIFPIKPRGWGAWPDPEDWGKTKGNKEGGYKEEIKSDGNRSDNNNRNSSSGGKKSNAPSLRNDLIKFVLPIFLLSMAGLYFLRQREMTFEEFERDYLATRRVKRLVIVEGAQVRVIVEGNSGHEDQVGYFMIGNLEQFIKKLESAQQSMGFSPLQFVPITYRQVSAGSTMVKVVPVILTVAAFFLFFRYAGGAAGGAAEGFMSFTKSKAKMFNKQDKIKVKFDDVAGLPEAKLEIKEFVDFLKNPKKYTDLGARLPKGAILSGPPGTGKTLLAKATAGEAGVPFFSTSGSDFMELYVGVGPSRVRDMFKQARENAPCIVFIDEIDAIGKERSRGGFSNEERENTLNQILVEMDGFENMSGVVVMASTNRVELLDKALLRPGRFDRNIEIDLPDIKSRKEIYDVHLKNITLDHTKQDEFASRLASLTPGFSGADIANSCNEAALIAVRKKRDEVLLNDFEEAIDRVVGGVEKKSKVMSPMEKKKVAFHEAGHAILGWFLEHTDPLLKVSIVPRGRGLGYAQYLPKDQYLRSEDSLNDRMVMAMGGRAAEEIVFGSITTGAKDDIDKVTRIAHSQVSVYGFNERIGPLSFQRKQNELRPYSEETAMVIDEEVRKIVHGAYGRAKDMLQEKKELLVKLADTLMEKEVLSNKEIVEILGERPYQKKTLADEYFHLKREEGVKVEEKKEEKEEKQEKVEEKKEEKEKEEKKEEEKPSSH
ncbi:peptidase M41, FtsH domain-containing protein [Planoprotostelium fungivorum]|uniref:Peptidase M41, FtsH domain-containing protein n=1 Tax=Planoprotostelium fungivorum TaxID=1890364 RepID=A0A2P6N158_9EUKA|nr:peptidase M41, FtsH domain-containing protein [Planoprotostelium fungivorum]